MTRTLGVVRNVTKQACDVSSSKYQEEWCVCVCVRSTNTCIVCLISDGVSCAVCSCLALAREGSASGK